MRRDVFQAIADPNRRAIIALLSKGSLPLNEVAAHFDVSRPAISRHVKILTECGLIIMRRQGRERYCDVQLMPLRQVADWTEQYRRFWNKKLDALGSFLAADAATSKKSSSITHKTRKK
jgi:DNA-binding transcriptional ArsR family regulator